MQARKLPSGSWRVQVLDHTETVILPDGSRKQKKIRKSFTCDDPSPAGKRECERMAAMWAADREDSPSTDLTFGEALDQYISARESVLSPCTVKDYKSTRKHALQGLMNKKIGSITQSDIQQAINIEAQNHSPKTVRNYHGLVTAVLGVYRPNFAVHTDLPKRVRPNIYVPSDEEIKALVKAVEGTSLELPVYLAAFGPMRRGEIAALRSEDIQGNIVHVCRNMVTDNHGGWIIKAPKSYAGDRYIDYPDFVAEKWKGIEGRIVNLTPNTISNEFRITLKKAGLPHFRFHDLRHYAASIQHAIGVPDAYIMQRGGWGNDGTLKAVYRHVLEDKTAEMDRKTNEYFSDMVHTKVLTENEEADK